MSGTTEHHDTTDASVRNGPSREAVRGGAVGTGVLAYFALAWTGWGMSTGVPTAVELPVIAAAAVCSVAILIAAVRRYRRAGALPAGGQPAHGARINRRFGSIVAAEFIGLAVIARVLVVTGTSQLIPAMVCLGVGIHFFPLARLFHAPLYDRTGAALCLIALTAAVVTPLSGHAPLWTMVPGFGAAITLYVTCALLIRGNITGRRADG